MRWLRNNSLSLVFFALFVVSIIGQAVTGLAEHNEHMHDDGGQQVGMAEYLTSGHFLQSTFENWESEFLQMALFVFLSMFLYQKGSSESKDPDATEQEDVDKEPDPSKPDAPAAVKHGGWRLGIYKHSLCYALSLCFVVTFFLHWYGSYRDHNEEQRLKGKAEETFGSYISKTRFWFESFQNWQSEFLSIFALSVFSIYLRQKGSPQSKPVDAPHSQTGE